MTSHLLVLSLAFKVRLLNSHALVCESGATTRSGIQCHRVLRELGSQTLGL